MVGMRYVVWVLMVDGKWWLRRRRRIGGIGGWWKVELKLEWWRGRCIRWVGNRHDEVRLIRLFVDE